MNLPQNGRIAIVDDQISQVEQLMKILSAKQLPFTYFSGEMEFLPDEIDNKNDFRILFLDINLIDNTERSNKELKSKLIPVLSRIVSEDNYPYVIIYWSRHERHKTLIEEEIFGNELKNRKPIAYLSAVKSDYFNLDGSPIEDINAKISSLLDKVKDLLRKSSAYSNLLYWENLVHNSVDLTLQEIFGSNSISTEWANNANYLMEKLGKAYLGKHFGSSSSIEKLRSSFITFNYVFKDTLESQIYNKEISGTQEWDYDITKVESRFLRINEKLNLSKQVRAENICESGTVLNFPSKDGLFSKLLQRVLSHFKLKNTLRDRHKNIDEIQLKKIVNGEFNRIKNEIKSSMIQIATVVTPICDYVQKENKIHDRIVKGVFIPMEYKDYIDDKSEAVYILPITIDYNDREYIMILDYRYFETIDLKEENVESLFRIRQELLAEVQSRLARHITRQGILFLDER